MYLLVGAMLALCTRGARTMWIHNTYSVIYNELVFNLLKQRFGEGEAVVFARSSTVGGQRFPVVSSVMVIGAWMTELTRT